MVNEHHGHEDSKAKYAMYAFAVALSYDSMATFLTMYFYWGAISGFKEQYFGMAFALYAVGTMFSSPVLAKWSQKRNIREPVLVSLILNIAGNVAYFFADSPSTDNYTSFGYGIGLFLIGRFVAGLGAGGLSLTLTYLISVSEESQRLHVMNRFRSLQFWGKFAGPLVATIFLYIPSADFGPIHLNSATWPALSTIVVEALIFVPCLLFTGSIHQQHVNEEDKMPITQDPIAKQMIADSLKIFPIFGASLIALWLVFSQIMPIGVILFGIANKDPSDIWEIYLPPIIGGLASLIIVKRLKSIPDTTILMVAAVGVIVSMFTFFQYSQKESSIIYYLGGSCLFFFNGTFATAFRSIYSLIVGQTRHLNVMMSILFVVGSIGQIIGPVISSVITVDTATDVAGCASCGEYFVMDQWDFSCCVLNNLNIAVAIAVGVLALATVYTGILLFVIKLPSLERRMAESRNNTINDEETYPIHVGRYEQGYPQTPNYTAQPNYGQPAYPPQGYPQTNYGQPGYAQ